MALKLSKRSDIETFRALSNLAIVNEKIEAGADIIRLEAGQPCFGAPQAVIDYARQALLDDPMQGYTDAMGAKFLREKIAQYYKDEYQVNIDYNRIAITVGSSAGLVMAFLAAFEAGDSIALCTPTYAAYKNILQSLDLNVVEIQTTIETNFQPSLELLQNTKKTFQGILINSPSNPSGTVIDEQEFEAISNWCDKQGIRVFSDEAYHKITYETQAQTALKFSDNCIVFNTFSKFFAMTGWRLGWVVVPEDMSSCMKKLAESLFVSPPTISQHAAYKAFDHIQELEQYVDHYKQNRDILRKGLADAGLTKISHADGAFYFFIDITDYSNDSEDFCARMLEEANVSATSGLDFDSSRGHHFIRISYAGSAQDMKEACRRLKKWLSSYQKVQNAAE